MDRAPDIENLEKMLNDGESDEELCRQAIEIFERLRNEVERVMRSGSPFERRRINAEGEDLERVVREIEDRRHEHALDRFKEYLNNLPD